MLLLVWIKSLTSTFDSPTVAYVCGQTIPWVYEDSLPQDPDDLLNSTMFKCLTKPAHCTADHYYRDVGGIFEELGLDGVRKCNIGVNTSILSSYIHSMGPGATSAAQCHACVRAQEGR